MNRAILTVATGAERYADMAIGLARSLQLIGDNTKRIIITDNLNRDWKRYFDLVLPPDGRRDSPFFAKYTALERTDFDQVLFIDSDCLAFKRLDTVFDLCSGSSVAVQGRWETDGIWYERSIKEVCQEFHIEKLPRLNSGVVYYERGPTFEKVLEFMRQVAVDYRKLGFEIFRNQVPDEPCLSLAMAKTGIGMVLPQSLNLNESGVGLIGKLHLDVLTSTCRFISGNPEVRFVEPYVFHAHYFSKLRVYWNELEKLEKLERRRDLHGARYMSRGLRLRRSIEKRYLKLIGKL